MHAVLRIREKWRHGLLLYWMFERLTSILAKIGIQLHPSVIYREFISQAPAPEIGLSDCTWEFATAAEMQELAQVPAYDIPLDELYVRLGERAECFVLRHRGSIVAFTWCQLDGPPRPRFGLTFGPKDAYLFNAHTDPAFRGRNVLPFLRHQLYLELTRRGRTNLISSTDIFNGPAHRFKRKLGAVPVEARLYVKFGNRIEKVFTLRRFPTARGPEVAPELAS